MCKVKKQSVFVWNSEPRRLLWEQQLPKIPQEAFFASEEVEALPMEREVVPDSTQLA